MDFISKDIEEYALKYTTQDSDLLNRLTRETWLKHLNPRMLSGTMQGRFLSMISYMLSPKRILEVGTFTGYSCLCLSEGLSNDGKIITIDCDEELEPMTRSYFEESNYSNRIDFRIGNALDIIPNLNETFDLVFIDADKINYSNYFDLIIDKVRNGGFIIADNVLWSGKVLMKEGEWDSDTKALAEYANKVKSDSRVEQVLLPFRDGLLVSRKM